MGLCKCLKKSVTNQFCFEHLVNVCEHCMVDNHSKCVVQSYILWLQDSDYDPNCTFCKRPLADDDCVRLLCYHVFHWACLDKYACEMPPNTAPAGYTCPTCGMGIFPSSNMVSPVAETLKKTLLSASWARCGLAFPLVEENNSSRWIEKNNMELMQQHSETENSSELKNKPSRMEKQYFDSPNSHISDMSRGNRPETYGGSYASGNFAAPRKVYDTVEYNNLKSTVDHDEKKYKRLSAFEWLSRWFQSKTLLGNKRRRDPNTLYKRWVVIGMLVLIALCTVIVWFLRIGRANADSDPMLDPHFNPNIRVEDHDNGHIQDSAKNVQKDFHDGEKVILPR